MKKYLIALIVVALIAGVGYSYWKENKAGTEDGWKTYTNEKFGYSIKYPNNWQIVRAVNSTSLYDHVAIRAKDYKNDPSGVDVNAGSCMGGDLTGKSIKIKGINYPVYTPAGGGEEGGGTPLLIPIENAGQKYCLVTSGRWSDLLIGINKEILETFKFTK